MYNAITIIFDHQCSRMISADRFRGLFDKTGFEQKGNVLFGWKLNGAVVDVTGIECNSGGDYSLEDPNPELVGAILFSSHEIALWEQEAVRVTVSAIAEEIGWSIELE